MTELIFRKATERDIPTICALRKAQLIDEGAAETPDIDPELAAFFTDGFSSGRFFELFAEEDGKTAATAALCFYDYPPSFSNKSGRIAYVTNMYTAPEFRHRGIATKLLSMLEAEAKSRGITVMRLGASKLGRPVYEKFGFRQDDCWMSKII